MYTYTSCFIGRVQSTVTLGTCLSLSDSWRPQSRFKWWQWNTKDANVPRCGSTHRKVVKEIDKHYKRWAGNHQGSVLSVGRLHTMVR
jgi:hypothetical protein